MDLKVGQEGRGSASPLRQDRPAAPREVLGVGPSSFQDQLAAVPRAIHVPGSAEDLVSEIERQARRLMERPSMGELAAYRELVRRFIKRVHERLGRVDQHTDRRNRTLAILRTLDHDLEQLSEDVLKSQAGVVDLAARLDAIRGLILDLLV
ncbi:MAG: YaaR family protein [Candidatus Sericytochromatia bacterium]|nr:YaaR family protein [Candidatus Sericytochromatia bacterium]